MASPGERTEAPTPRRKQEMREQGKVARSQEVQAAAALLVGFVALRLLGPGMIEQLASLSVATLARLNRGELTMTFVGELAGAWGLYLLGATLPLAAVMLATGVVSGGAQSGLLFSTKAAAPDLKRLNPLNGIKRLFSTRSLVELVKGIIKIALVSFVGWRLFEGRQAEILMLSQLMPVQAGALVFSMVVDIGLQVSIVYVVIAGLDYGYQRWMFNREARMTKQEVKEQNKQTEGDPQIRARIRQQARNYAKGRMLQDVPRAAIVITNPTHLAIALEYDPDSMAAPKIIAKGERLMAQRIKDIAREHRVPIMENKPLAWALHRGAEIGDYVPRDLYQAVAEVLAFVFSVNNARRRPSVPSRRADTGTPAAR